MVPFTVPGPVGERARDELRRRWRRVWPRLLTFWFLIPILCMVPSGWAAGQAFGGGDPGALSVILAVAALAADLAVLGMWWFGLVRRRCLYEPGSWSMMSGALGLFSAVSLCLACWAIEQVPVIVAVPASVWVVAGPLVAAFAGEGAQSRLLRPDPGVLGASSFKLDEYALRIRTDGEERHGSLAILPDTVALRIEPVLARQNGGVRAASDPGIDLRSITVTGVVAGDGRVWTRDRDGRGLICGEEPALLLHAAGAQWLIPVARPEDAAAVIAARVEWLTGRAPRSVTTNRLADTPPVEAPDTAARDTAARDMAAPDTAARDTEAERRWAEADAASARQLVAEAGLTPPPGEGALLTASETGTPETLRPGPGIAVRWLMVLPLLAIALAGAPLVAMLVPEFGRFFVPEGLMFVAAGVLAGVASWRRPHHWPLAALASTGPLALMLLFGARTGGGGEQAGWAIGVLAVGVLGALAASAVAVRPSPRADLAGGPWTLRIPLRAPGRGRLVLEDDRVVVEHRQRAGAGRVAIPWRRLLFVQAGTFDGGAEPSRWPLPDGATLALGTGPALRVVADNQQWLVPLGQPSGVAGLVSRRARARAATATAGAHDLPLRQWIDRSREARSARREPVRTRLFSGGVRGYLTGWLLGAALTALIVAGAVTGGRPELLWIGVPLLGIPTVLAFVLWRMTRTAARQAELYPLPPGFGPWGETRPGHAPLPGWRPLWTVRIGEPGAG